MEKKAFNQLINQGILECDHVKRELDVEVIQTWNMKTACLHSHASREITICESTLQRLLHCSQSVNLS